MKDISMKLRDRMMFFQGQLAALGFIPFYESPQHTITDFYESLEYQYKVILNEILGDSYHE